MSPASACRWCTPKLELDLIFFIQASKSTAKRSALGTVRESILNRKTASLRFWRWRWQNDGPSRRSSSCLFGSFVFSFSFSFLLLNFFSTREDYDGKPPPVSPPSSTWLATSLYAEGFFWFVSFFSFFITDLFSY
jgi:hypothetical protein